MIVLGIETATFSGGVALVKDRETLGVCEENTSLTHSRRLLKSVDTLQRETGLSTNDIDGVAVSIGPGSFTGLRIGLSVAKSIAYTICCDIVGVSTLEALARRQADWEGMIAPVLDARRNEIFGALFKREGAECSQISEDVVCGIEAFLGAIKEPTMFCGTGVDRYRKEIIEMLGVNAHFAPPETNHPSAVPVACIGAERLAAGHKDILATLTPCYLRKSDAERKQLHNVTSDRVSE